jgi:hypothetical protein
MPIDDAIEDIDQKDEIKDLRNDNDALIHKLEEKNLKESELKDKIINQKNEIQQYKDILEREDTDLQKSQKDIIRGHIKGLSNFWPEHKTGDKFDEAIVKFLSTPDFINTYINTLILQNTIDKQEYMIMQFYEHRIINTFDDVTEFMRRLAPLGLNLICPYYQRDNGKISNYTCSMDNNAVEKLCHGKHDICSFFHDRATKFITGETQRVDAPNTYVVPQIILPQNLQRSMERKIKDELESYWRDE